MRVYHRKCGNDVVYKFDSLFTINGGFSISSDGEEFVTNTLSIQKIGRRARIKKKNFVCMYCGVHVPFTSMQVSCTHCGKIINVSEAKFGTSSGAIVCEKCQKDFQNYVDLIDVFEKITTIK